MYFSTLIYVTMLVSKWTLQKQIFEKPWKNKSIYPFTLSVRQAHLRKIDCCKESLFKRDNIWTLHGLYIDLARHTWYECWHLIKHNYRNFFNKRLINSGPEFKKILKPLAIDESTKAYPVIPLLGTFKFAPSLFSLV